MDMMRSQALFRVGQVLRRNVMFLLGAISLVGAIVGLFIALFSVRAEVAMAALLALILGIILLLAAPHESAAS